MTTNSQTTIEHFDVLVIGSGEAGKYVAWTLSGKGKKTALVERRYVGGSCPNIACLPSKNIIHSAKVARFAAEAESYGLPRASGRIDFAVVRQRKRDMVAGLVQMHEERFAQTGVALIRGTATFLAPKMVEVAENGQPSRRLSGDQIVISTGSHAMVDPIDGLAECCPLTHIEALELDTVPERLIILGGGYVGLEFAQAMRRFGSHVIVVERNGRLLPREDLDVSQELTRILTGEGVEIQTDTHVSCVHGRSGERVSLTTTSAGSALEIAGTHLLVATGRVPNTNGLNLDAAGIALTPKGFIQVNEHLQTTAPDVFAVGDCAGSPHFTHIAYDDYRVVTDVLAGSPRSTVGRLVPSCLFTDPELARVGLNETEANRQGINYRLLKVPMKAVLRTRTTGQTNGFLKALVAADNTILGFTAIGQSGGDIMAVAQLAMSIKLPYPALGDSIFTHPTYAEGLVALFSSNPIPPTVASI